MLGVVFTHFAVLHELELASFATHLLFEGFVVFVVLCHVAKSATDATLETKRLTGTFFLFCHIFFKRMKANALPDMQILQIHTYFLIDSLFLA